MCLMLIELFLVIYHDITDSVWILWVDSVRANLAKIYSTFPLAEISVRIHVFKVNSTKKRWIQQFL